MDLTLTTNGSALRALARPLAEAGLKRVTVSLDSLDDATFGAMNGIDFPVERVLDGIAAAIEAGLTPVKINMVVRRGVNEADIVPMAAWARDIGATLRFIEYMDVGHSNGWQLDEVVPAQELIERLGAEWPVEPADPHYRGEVADRWRYLDGHGEFGVISSVTQPFCRDCTRARLSAEGKLYTCLFAVQGSDLRAVLRGGATDAELQGVRPRRLVGPLGPVLRTAIRGRPPRCHGSRCSRWAADARALIPDGSSTGLSTGPRVPWTAIRPSGTIWWITALTVRWARP